MIPKISGLSSAIDGLNKASAQIEKSAQSINRAFAAAQNAQAADSVSISDSATVAPAVEDAMRGAVLPPEGEISKALVDMLQAKAAYKANIEVVKVTGDIENELAKVLRRRDV